MGKFTIGEGVTSVGSFAFHGCSRLSDIHLSANLTSIGHGAFWSCSGLHGIVIPAKLSSLGLEAFWRCRRLKNVTFLGDAPTLPESPSWAVGLFEATAPTFSTYFLSGSMGFTSPTWAGYPAAMIDEASFPAARWLLENGLVHDTDLRHDLNSDGVNLMMAYALSLDPSQNLANRLPVPVMTNNSLNLTFHAATPGIVYKIETSTDLRNWTTEGVVYSELAPDNRRTASINRDSAKRYLRLVVEEGNPDD